MFVAVTAESVVVGEPDDCSSLDVRTPRNRLSVLDATLQREHLGSWDGGDKADLVVAELRRKTAVGVSSADWEDRWGAMIAYAQARCWLSADGATVRAHVVEIPA